MTVAVAPLADALARIDPGEAALRTRLLAALDGFEGPGFVVRAAVAAGSALPAAIRFAAAGETVELAPALVDGTLPSLLADDGRPDAVLALATLTALEPLIAAVERQLGVALDPVGVDRPQYPLRLRLDAVEPDGQVRNAVELGVSVDSSLSPQPIPPRPEVVAALPADWRFEARGPRLTPERLRQIGTGDLVLVGGRHLSGRLVAADRDRPARFAPSDGAVTIAAMEYDVPEPEPATDPGMTLPLTVHVGGGTATVGALAALAPGSVLPLGVPGGSLAVTLLVAGAPFASGELVAIGDSYGVLIGRRVEG